MGAGKQQFKQRFGSLPGLIATIAIGFVICFILQAVPLMSILPTYDQVISTINTPASQFLWFFMNFTEPNFYAGVFSSVFMLIGSAIAWQLSVHKSKYAGFKICYGNANI